MIKSIRFENFYSFKNATVEFHPQENILIGINGSGKSNFLKAIRMVKEGVSGIGLQKLIFDIWGGIDNIRFSDPDDRDETNLVVLEYCFDAEIITSYGYAFTDDIHYKIIIHKSPGVNNYYVSEYLYFFRNRANSDRFLLDFHNGKGRVFGKQFLPDNRDDAKGFYETKLMPYTDSDPRELVLKQITDSDRFPYHVAIKNAITDIVVYDYFDTTPFSKIRKPMSPTSEDKVLADGSNLPQILNTLNINFKMSYKKILEKLNDVNSNYNNIDFHFIGGNIELMLGEKHLGKSIHVTNISDGTLRFLCLLAIFYNPKRGRLVCIDEPEVGLHPDMILTITAAMHESSKETQLVVATHAESILNEFQLDHIRVFEKNQTNQSIVQCYSKEDFDGWYQEYISTGKQWRQGDLGGNRW